MSEQLKSYKMVDEDYCDNALFVVPSDVYLKSEADKVIAEKDKEIAELEERIADGDKDFDMANSQNERLLKFVRHHKYKRCMAMAKLCNEKWLVHNFAEIPVKLRFYDKWEKRWLELAEKFKKEK